jgi:hypothetical protein
MPRAIVKRDNNSISLAGEFAVLSQLALRGYDANMTLGRTKGVDILASHPATGKMFKLEVKTKYRDSSKEMHRSAIFGKVKGEWIMNEKQEGWIDPLLFYCFVIVSPRTTSFQFYIVPSSIVAKYVKEQHVYWLKETKRLGKAGKTSKIRTFRIGFDGDSYPIKTPTVKRYENNWDFKT